MNSVHAQDFDIEKFITMIKDHNFIYNPRDPKHCNRFIVSTSWKNIALEMNSTEKICRNKWTTLRSNYVRELRKHNDPTSPPKTKWPYYDILSFLQPYIKSRVPPENSLGTEAEDEYSLDESNIKHEDYVDEKNWLDTAPNNEPIIKKRPYQNDYDNQILNEQMKIKETHTIDEDDDDKHFLLSILPQIRQLSSKDNLLFRLEVQQLLINKLFPYALVIICYFFKCFRQAEQRIREILKFLNQ